MASRFSGKSVREVVDSGITREAERLREARDKNIPWRKWGPYLSERQWGTVREDYSDDGNAWDYFSHDQARSRAYRWGEDGLAGFCDDKSQLCFALALWNGRDPIIKERLFGLTNSEGNHGEDVKEYYFYLDSTPTHSYLKWLYKYPQTSYPYVKIIDENRKRSRTEPEYELLDTGIFDDNRYFDVFVEYAKASPEDILIRIKAFNRGADAADLDLLPTLWFRNTWTYPPETPRPSLALAEKNVKAIEVSHPDLRGRWLYYDGESPVLFTENETNLWRVSGFLNESPFVKDAINDYIVAGKDPGFITKREGTKAAVHFHTTVKAGGSVEMRLRLTDVSPHNFKPFSDFDHVFDERRQEADEFYRSITPTKADDDTAAIMRQAFSGMLWGKQYYLFDVFRWLREHKIDPLGGARGQMRNRAWYHMVNEDVISMPDKWEYPWYAAWDLAFHAIALAGIDPDFAKEQLLMMLEDKYIHPSGQIPAYEWAFGDVNPPVHAWATIFLHRIMQYQHGETDIGFLKKSFHKLTANFSWWLNRKDRFGNNLYEGGFLGLDNIGVFDRSAPLPTGGHLEQADGTAWMALFCQNMLEIAVEIAAVDPDYEMLAVKFVEQFFWISNAINNIEGGGMWDEEDGFYYDVLRTPDGHATRLKVRSMVGLLPICASTVIEPWQRERVPRLTAQLRERIAQMPELLNGIHPTGPGHLGYKERGILAVVNPHRLRRILTRVLDENEFLSPYGVRALSKAHAEQPYVFRLHDREFRVDYVPGDSDSGMFGGNSNWRGPVWLPVNALLIRALLQYYLYYGDSFKIECPTGSGKMMNLYEAAREIANRLIGIFKRDESGRRAVHGKYDKFQTDPHWRDYINYYEYFHGDSGAGIGASHQTGWTGLVSTLIQFFQTIEGDRLLEAGRSALGTPIADAGNRVSTSVAAAIRNVPERAS
jgi:hypothetical protein